SVTVVAKLSETTSNAVSVPFTVSGSATGGGTDYTMTSSPLTIPAGSTTATITINILDDGISEGSETIVIDMGTPTNADKGIPSSHTVTITDNISVSFGDPSPSNYITEAVDTETEVTISVDLSEVSEDDITVPFSLGGSASEGEGLDYTISPDSQVIIPAGSLSSVITFTILDDIETEELEYLKLTMGEPNNDAVKGSPSERTIFIQDNEISHCDISSVSFAMGTDSITWSLKNNGEAVLFTRGIITWPAASPNAPRLDWIQFRGVTVHDANESPGTLDYDASPMVSFIFEDTQPLLLQFNSALGSGDYFISAYFENQDAAGYTCSVEYTIVNYIP
ncbi:MAG: Calx-beta domain-containing protein, partial [Chloroflexota bacterium]|nr:Calx-beta domain-containing protein [Chloroflexota bacterium]